MPKGSPPRALVIRTAGTNCDAEMCRAFESCGANVELVHVDRLIADPSQIDAADLIGFPGGFSHGDDIASGRIFAMKLREKLSGPLRAAAARGVPMIGACNGFQVMVQVGLLPGPIDGDWSHADAMQQKVSLASNAGGRFIDRWVRVVPNAESNCIWTRPLVDVQRGNSEDWESGKATGGRTVGGSNAHTTNDLMMLPIAHGEGRVVVKSASGGGGGGGGEVLESLRAHGQIALTYASDDNPNGSVADIAGICDVSGRIFGLMPHPERYLEWTNHPFWTRLDISAQTGEAPGAMMFRAAVEAAVAMHA